MVEKSLLCDNPKCGRFVPTYRANIGITTCSRECAPSSLTRSSGLSVATSTVGTIAELMVSADLLRRGFAVFRALSPACECDLIVLVNCKPIRIEVRSGSWSQIGTLLYPWNNKKDLGRSDILAIYLHRNNKIIYKPDPFAMLENEDLSSESVSR